MRSRLLFTIFALLASAGIGNATKLPKCVGSPAVMHKDHANYKKSITHKWKKCVGSVEYRYGGRFESSFYGEFDPTPDISFRGYKRWANRDGSISEREGYFGKKTLFGGTKFVDEKTPYGPKSNTVKNVSTLQAAFESKNVIERKLMQESLRKLGFYKSSIDGLFGPGTQNALETYNEKYFNNSDLNISPKAFALVTALLQTAKSKVELKPKPKTVTAPKPIKNARSNLETEFGLSFYGSFLHSEKVPKSLFFFGDIDKSDSFEFRKALRNHEIDLIILSSPGGLVWEGLSIAGIIHDKELDTYVPQNSLTQKGNCASACSFMFFAGANRSINGKLGVHQFYASDSTKEAKIGDTQQNAQFTVSEIIGFLNEFETPPWVFERMFQQSEMYYFKESELLQLETETTELQRAVYGRVEAFISELRIAYEETKKSR